MAENEINLEQTKSKFTFVGIVDGMEGDNVYREDEIKNGKNAGKMYRAVRFYIKTSPDNRVPVELFGMEMDYVYPYKRGKKGEKGKTKKIEFSKRDKLPEGYHIIGVNMGLEQNENGKNIRKSMVDYDAAEYIYDNLNNGDSVTVEGELSFSTYKNSDGDEIEQTRYVIKNIYKEKEPIDFNSEKFKEICAFEQEIVFVDSDFDEEEGAVFVNAYTIQYGNRFTPAKFVVRPNGNKDIEKTANAFAKKLEFGDFVKVYGLALNLAETVEVEVENDNNDDIDDIFGGEKPEGLEKRAITNYVTELRITGADNKSFVKGKYTEDDFVIEELVEEEDSDDDDDDMFGSGVDIDEDDLPF